MSLIATADSGQGAPALPINPCMQGASQVWSAVRLEHATGAAPRDGLLFSASLSAPLQGGIGSAPATVTASVEVVEATGMPCGGSFVRDASRFDTTRFAFRPTSPLAPNTRHTVRVTLVNNVAQGCQKPPDVMQSFEIVTVAELTPGPPEPPLRSIAYGEVWWSQERACCEPRAATACDGVRPCAKCWSSAREPTVVPQWDAPLASAEPLEYALLFDAIERLNEGVISGFGFGALPPTLAFRPLALQKSVLSLDQPKVCMTGAIRNFRTGQVSLRPRCTLVTHDTAQLSGLSLPPGVSLAAPDSTLEVSAPDCVAPALEREGLVVAASYFTSRERCMPECSALFPIIPGPVAGGAARPMQPTMMFDAPQGHPTPHGCTIVSAGDEASALGVWAMWWLCSWQRRRRSVNVASRKRAAA